MAPRPEQMRPQQAPILALDPGRGKCGLAVATPDGTILERLVVPLNDLPVSLAKLHARHRPSLVILGNRTGASDVAAIIKQALPHLPVRLVDEHRSTEQARGLYFADNPPRRWRRLIPRGLLVPPEPYDDYVAIVLAQRFLASQHQAREGKDEE